MHGHFVLRRLPNRCKLQSIKCFICGLATSWWSCIIFLRRMLFYWRLAHSISKILQDCNCLQCYFVDNFLYDAELIVWLNEKHRPLKKTHTKIFIDDCFVLSDFNLWVEVKVLTSHDQCSKHLSLNFSR